MKPSARISFLLDAIEEGYQRKAWHGPNLRGAIRGLSAAQVSRRPGRNRHTIREIVVHCAYWKYAVWRRITGEKRGSFPLKGSNWFPGNGGAHDERGWREDVRLLDTMHRRLVDAVRRLPPGRLKRIPPGGRIPAIRIITGIAMHDVYHAGQIQLLKKISGR